MERVIILEEYPRIKSLKHYVHVYICTRIPLLLCCYLVPQKFVKILFLLQAELYKVKKDYAKAEPLYLEAINILEEYFGINDIR